MGDITVPVPDERTAEFYQFFGLWLAGALNVPGSTSGGHRDLAEGVVTSLSQAELEPWGDTEQDLEDAVTLWRKYSKNARAMFGLLMDNPDKEFTGAQIAEAVNIPNGAYGVAGVLAWPGRHGWRVGRKLPTEWRDDPESSQSYYRMPAQTAELFKAARAKVEQAS